MALSRSAKEILVVAMANRSAASEITTAIDANTLTNSGDIHSNGTVAFAANQPMGGFKLTGLGAGTAAGNSVRYEQAILISGVNAFTANQPMGSHKLTGLSAGTTAGDSLRFEQIVAYSSTAGAGGASSEIMVVTGLLSTDTILAVSQKTAGANSLPLLGWTTQANNALTVQWSADPGAGSVIVVSVKR